MKHISFCLLSLLIVITSCADSDFSAGSSLFNEQVKNIIVDTTTVSLQTVLSDSTASSGISKIFMGNYQSSELGFTSAKAFVSFSVPSYSTSDFSSTSKIVTKLDSVCLILPYDKYSYGDTTKAQTINISLLTQRLDDLYTDHNSVFYTNQSVTAETTPFLTKAFSRPRASQENDSTLIIRLSDEFGQEFLDSMKTQSAIFDSEANFIKFFKGFKLSPGDDDQYCINAFKMTSSSAPKIRIYYHSYDVTPLEKTIDIEANTSYAFSHIDQDRSNTLLADLTSDDDISSTVTENKAYLQGMVGVSTQMTFPYINELMQYGEYTNVAAAYLYVYPAKDSYSDFTPLPKNVKLNFVNKVGDVKDIYVASTTSLVAGVLTEDATLSGRYYYAFDVTSFITSEIKAAEIDKGTLQLDLSDTDKANSLKRLIIGDSNYSDSNYRIKLVIQLLVYNYD
ncbi:MAG: hypothetical protein H6Q14_2095 [Bacteroidetes bacterium]|jgi:hypothetical protein|nr:hypothetical protein [Bacteroidota bacterium]